MRVHFASNRIVVLLILLSAPARTALAALQPISISSTNVYPAAGGGGDSGNPLISPDGRYVIFASTANNLVLNSNSAPIPALWLPALNVYLRDRNTGTTTLVSVNQAGTEGGNADSLPRGVSTNGQFVLFESAASNLVPGDTNNQSDVFVRDLVAGSTFLVSVNTNGVSGNGPSHSSVITPDGRYIAFASAASDLVSGDTNIIPDVFIRDLQSATTTLVSVGAMATNSNPVISSISDSPEITPDGRFVAFFSTATNLVPGVTAAGDVYVRDLSGGTTTWASVNARNLAQTVFGTSNVICYSPTLSHDGQFLAFEVSSNLSPGSATSGLLLRYGLSSGATDLIFANANVPYQQYENIRNADMTPDGRFVAFAGNTNGTAGKTTCVLLWDASLGSINLVSGDLAGNVPTNSLCGGLSISPDGQFVVFVSNATNLTANALLGDYHIYRRDVLGGSTTLVDSDTNGMGTGVGWEAAPSISADGRYVAFQAADGSLVPNDSNRRNDAFVRDSVAQTNELISAHDPGLPSLTPNGDSAVAPLSVSADGRYVAFSSEASDVAPPDNNGARDVFMRDLLTSSNVLVSVNTNGSDADGASTDPSVNADGRYVAFTSYADNLVAGDTNGARDVLVRDLQTGQTVAASVSADGSTLGNGDSFSPTISADGRQVLYHSKAQNLAAGSFGSGIENLFLRDLQIGTNYALTKATTGAGVTWAALTPDGRYAGFVGQVSGTSQALYVWDTQTDAYIYTNFPVAAVTAFTISPDGQWLAYATYLGLTLLNVPAKTSTYLSSGMPPSAAHGGIQFSADAHWLVYSIGSSTAGTNQVFLYDTGAGTNFLISQNYSMGGAASGNSDDPTISPDGRYIAFRSTSTNLVAGIMNGAANLFVYDRVTGTTSLLSTTADGNAPSAYLALAPIFSGDSRTIVFRSFGSDLSAQDFNQSGDVFGYSFLYLRLSASVTPGSGPTLSWPAAPGETYLAQYKNDLSDSSWLPVSGTVSIQGNRASLIDPTPAAGQRFYRVVATQP